MPHDIAETWQESMKDPTWQKALKGFIKKKYSLDEIAEQHRAWKSTQLEKNLEGKKF